MSDTAVENSSAPAEVVSGKRERKATTFYVVPAAAAPKKVADEVAQGEGMLLSDYEYFVEKLTKLRSDDELVKALHQLMYGTPGKKTETKKNLRAFRGFPAESNLEERVSKLIEKKKIWTVALLKGALDLFGCEKGGDRDALCHRLVHYLASPENLKKVSGSKRKASSSKGGKRKKSKKSKKTKGVSRVSGFLLFSKASRSVLKEKKPDLSFAEVGTELGRLWKSLSAEEQKEWNDQAVEVNRAVAAGADAAAASDDDGEEEGEDEDEEGSADEEDDKSTGSEDDIFGDSDEDN